MDLTKLLDWHFLAAILSVVFAAGGMIPYVGDILRGGDTKPNAVSFFLWSVCEIIALFAQIKAGWSWSVVIVAIIVCNTTIIFVLSISGYGHREYHKLDFASLAFSILAIVLWKTAHDPSLEIVFAILADIFASVPTLAKVYREPFSEQQTGWILGTSGCGFGVLSTNVLNVANLAFPTYMFLMSGLILSFIVIGRKVRLKCA